MLPNPEFDFSGKKVLVTGASQGIGLEIAKQFHLANAEVVITGTRGDKEDYDGELDHFDYVQTDLSEPEHRKRLAERVRALDILVNNAGISDGSGGEFEMDGFRKTLEVDLVAPSDLAFRFANTLSQNKGSIINIGSAACFLAIKDAPSYTASKAGLLGLTRSLADKWASQGIRVNLVAPGYIDTCMTSSLKSHEKFTENLKRILPLRRWGNPEDIAPAVLFLASPSASYITGQSLIIDGGLMLR